MNDPLKLFRDVMWISGITCVLLGALLLCMTVWGARWRRLLNAEEAFWRRLGVGARWIAPMRRLEESKGLLVAAAALFTLHFALLLVAAGAHAHFAPILKRRPAPPLLPKQAPARPADPPQAPRSQPRK